MKLAFAGRSDVGRRANNEDAFVADGELGIFAVADGMGGYEGGEVASGIVVENLTAMFRHDAEDPDATWPFAPSGARRRDRAVALVEVAVRLAHREIRARRQGPLAQMGSTVAALALRIDDAYAVAAHVGDSRVYRLRDGRLEQLTRDHSLYEEMRAAGTADLPSREDFPYSNVVTRALGVTDEGAPDVRRVELAPGDTFLICSDGLEPVPPERIAAHLAPDHAPDAACEALIADALASGSRDNITCVVVRV